MICNISLVDVGEDQWIYQLIYDNKKQDPVPYDLPFEEMGPLERTRFISEMFSPAFLQEQFDVLDARPKETTENYLNINLDDLDEDDEVDEADPNGVGQQIVDLLNELKERVENLEIESNKNKDDTK